MKEPIRKTRYTDLTYKYATISDATTGTSADVWDPAAGKALRITGAIVSANDAGVLQIRDKTGNVDIAVLRFGAAGFATIDIGGELGLAADSIIEAKWTAAAGTKIADITLFGEEV